MKLRCTNFTIDIDADTGNLTKQTHSKAVKATAQFNDYL